METELNYILIGQRLRAIRKKRGFTQEQIAELADVSPQHISGIETGGAKVSLSALVRLCNVLNTTPDVILMDSVKQSEALYSSEIAEVFGDCSADELYLMLSQAKNLKKELRLRNFSGVRNYKQQQD